MPATKVNQPLPKTATSTTDKPAEATKKTEIIAGLPITDIDEMETHLKFLIFGDAGVGKTVLAASAEAVSDMSPVLFIDAEGGTLSLQGMYQPDVIRVTSYSDMMRVLKDLRSGKFKYKTVVVDSLSEVTLITMSDVMGEKIKRNAAADIHLPEFADWNRYTNLLKNLIRGYRNLDMNVIFTCGVQHEKLNGIDVAYPMMDGKIRSGVRYHLDLVLYMYTKRVGDEEKRLLTGTTTATVAAKTRGYKLPPVIENPTMDILYDAIINVSKKDTK